MGGGIAGGVECCSSWWLSLVLKVGRDDVMLCGLNLGEDKSCDARRDKNWTSRCRDVSDSALGMVKAREKERE